MPPRSEKTEERHVVLRRQGFCLARDAAKNAGVDITTIYRWMEDGKVTTKKVCGFRYVALVDIVKMIGGMEMAVTMGVITPEEAAGMAES